MMMMMMMMVLVVVMVVLVIAEQVDMVESDKGKCNVILTAAKVWRVACDLSFLPLFRVSFIVTCDTLLDLDSACTLTLPVVQEVSFNCNDMGNLMDKITSATARAELFKQVMGGVLIMVMVMGNV